MCPINNNHPRSLPRQKNLLGSEDSRDSLPTVISSDISDTSSGCGYNSNVDPVHLQYTGSKPKIILLPSLYGRKAHGDSNSKQSSSRSSLSVAFSTIEIRSFPVVLGDNPACDNNGPPLSIDWEHISSQRVQLDRYEQWREYRGGPRSSNELKIGGFFRQKILTRSGACTREEIHSKMQEMEMIRKRRNRTKLSIFWQAKIKSFFFPKRKSRDIL
jgi:hypothetical protein